MAADEQAGLLLPHGYEVRAEHSSARLERYLQLCAEDNMQVVNCTTPANYFHVLRRQMMRDFRKPLVVMTPKSLLRHKECVSELADIGPDTSYQVFDERDPAIRKNKARRFVLCSGKVYYDLLEERKSAALRMSASCVLNSSIRFRKNRRRYSGRSRQPRLSPFRRAKIWAAGPLCATIWKQRWPRQAWPSAPIYAGRPAAASPATGSMARHQREQAALVDAALAADCEKLAAE